MKKTAVALAMLTLVGVVLIAWRASGGPRHDDPGTAGAVTPAVAASAPAPAPPSFSAAGPRQLPATGDADSYAEAVAGVVFGMDTRAHDVGEYRALLLGEADRDLSVTGFADLERLVDDRLPSIQEWARMRANAQWSDFAPGQVWEPGSWAQVVIGGQAEPGWVVRNVTGVQTTRYTEATVEKSAVRERTVTIAMRCPAEGVDVEACGLLLVGGSVLP